MIGTSSPSGPTVTGGATGEAAATGRMARVAGRRGGSSGNSGESVARGRVGGGVAASGISSSA